MKVQDLMIGDWVNTPKGNYRVTAIQDNDVIFTDYSDDIEGAVDIDDVNSIPLTPEILEKNGFVKQEDGCFRYFKSYDENYYFGFESISFLFERKTAKITKEHSQSGMQEKVEFTCEYLHELQHALKLCHIEKTIEL